MLSRETPVERPRASPFATTVLVGVAASFVITLLAFWAFGALMKPIESSDGESKGAMPLEKIPFDGKRAFEFLKAQCAIGPRPMGSANMAKLQEMLVRHFQGQGAQVELQRFQARGPLDGKPVQGANLIAVWRPDATDRVLLCAHYDTRPYPDQDRVNLKGVFVGANDGASGVAVLMELGGMIKDLPETVGVDFVLFDGEELVYKEGDPYFLGSIFFAREYAAKPPKHRYRCAVLLDMVGDANLKIVPDRATMGWPESKPLVEEIWSIAEKLEIHEFTRERGPRILDDHLQLRNIAKIPACDLIDFEYPYWHTQQDTPDKCSARSLAIVGWVLHEWLKQPHGPGYSLTEGKRAQSAAESSP